MLEVWARVPSSSSPLNHTPHSADYSWVEVLRRRFDQLAVRRGWACLCVALFCLVLRVAVLPNPVAVFHELTDVLRTGEFIEDLRVTLTELLVAFSISSTLGITLGYLISRSQYSIRVFEPLFAGIYSVPMILFLPLYILFFGLGPPSKIAIGNVNDRVRRAMMPPPGTNLALLPPDALRNWIIFYAGELSRFPERRDWRVQELQQLPTPPTFFRK